jgi:hypothetical protein
VFENRTPYADSKQHLEDMLALLELRIKRQMAVLNIANPNAAKFDEFSGMYVSEEEIHAYLDPKTKPADTRQVYNHKTVKALTREIERRREEIDQRVNAALEQEIPLRLVLLKERFQLTQTQIDILLCCLAPDIDMRFERYFAYLQNDVSRKRPGIQLLSRMFLGENGEHGAVFEARGFFNRDSGLFGKNLFRFNFSGGDDIPFPSRQPVIADSVIDFLLEDDHLDASIRETARLGQSRPMDMYAGYFDNHVCILESLVRICEENRQLPPVYIGGPGGAGKTQLVETFAAVLDKKVLTADFNAIMTFPGDFRHILALLEREARLHSALLHIRLQSRDDMPGKVTGGESRTDVLHSFLQNNRLEAVILTGIDSYARIKDKIGGGMISFFIPMPTVEERYELWSRLLTSADPAGEEEWINGLAVKFRFTPGRIRAVLDAAAIAAPGRKDDKPVIHLDDIYKFCREESDKGLLSYSRKIVPHYRWKDIVLPRDTLAQLKEICTSIQNRRKVYSEWGFEAKFSLGKGLNILLTGPPGIGKTMSAEIIAAELGLDLYKIDLSCVVSKYIGETEKNLSKIFKEAETSNCILFFDEADALFGKRTEVRDSHDRYANIEINFLLQKMDEYDGIVLMATNMRKNLDTAFTRRLHHVVEFPFPDEKYRGMIWKNAFPADTPKADDIDFDFLAGKFKIAGGNIKNIVVNSAFLASANGGVVNMENIILALKREYRKMGKMCSKSDFGRYYELVREVTE